MAHVEIRNGKPVLTDDWHDDDIYQVAEEMGVTLEDSDIEFIMEIIADAFDANNGINWTLIEYAIEEYRSDSLNYRAD